MDPKENILEIQYYQDLIKEYTKRLRILEKQAAKFGSYIPPHIEIEIEEINTKLNDFQIKMNNLNTPYSIAPRKSPSTSYLVSTQELALATYYFWISSDGASFISKITDQMDLDEVIDNKNEIIRSIQESCKFFERRNLPIFKNEVVCSLEEEPGLALTTYRIILTGLDKNIHVFSLESVDSYKFVERNGFFSSSTEISIISKKNEEKWTYRGTNLEEFREDTFEIIRDLERWKFLPRAIIDLLGKRRIEDIINII